MNKIFALLLLVNLVFSTNLQPQPSMTLDVLDRAGKPVSEITDGDFIQLRVRLGESASGDVDVAFTLGLTKTAVAACSIPSETKECLTPGFRAFGWYWTDGPTPAQPQRNLTATLNGESLPVSLPVTVKPRPVIMVHGFLSDYSAWQNYLGSQGYLAGAGIKGYAVGDGQVEGVMNTGSIDQPKQATNTIAQNAAVLADYIDRVQAQTGAETVDLLGHSMGGMISRYYIDRLMPERDVAQLIMLGTPSAGSDCAVLPSTLGFYMPTVLEIRSSYMVNIFNRQITRRHDVPYFALAGTKITSPVGSPCTNVPSDLVVSVDSVTSIDLDHQEVSILHTEMNLSTEVFQSFVLPLLQRSPASPWTQPDPPDPAAESAPLQFTRVFTGHVDPGSSVEHTINLESGLAVASFALYDPSRSLQVEVTGASGAVIELTADQHGLIQVDDPSTLVTMGYGFANPRPGPWKIKLSATGQTPASGSDYALSALLAGGAELSAAAEPLLPETNQPVRVSASLAMADTPITIERAEAFVRGPDGYSSSIDLNIDNNQAQAQWEPPAPGLYGLDLTVFARLEDGTAIERTAYLTVEAAPPAQAFAGRQLALVISFALIILLGLGILLFAVRSARRKGK